MIYNIQIISQLCFISALNKTETFVVYNEKMQCLVR